MDLALAKVPELVQCPESQLQPQGSSRAKEKPHEKQEDRKRGKGKRKEKECKSGRNVPRTPEPEPEPEPEPAEVNLPWVGVEGDDHGLSRDMEAAMGNQAMRVERLELVPAPRSIVRTPSPATSIGSSESFDSGDESKFQPPRRLTTEQYAPKLLHVADSRFHSCHEEGQLHCLTSCPVGVGCIVILVTAAITFSLAINDVVTLAGSVEGECQLPDTLYRHCKCAEEESFSEPGIYSVACIQHHAASDFNALFPYPGPGSLPSQCNFTREMPQTWVASEEVPRALQEAMVNCKNALQVGTVQVERCWMLPAERGTAWNHCVGKGDTYGPVFANSKSEARSLVSFSSILIFLALLFLFKCPWTRTRHRALSLHEQTRRNEWRRRQNIGN